MAVRLNVILIEPASAGGAVRRLAETMVGELIGRAGIDLALIGPLDRLAPESTDRLTLDGISGDACVLDWQPAHAIHASLQALGFLGRRAAHPHDLAAASDPSSQEAFNSGTARRIYAFDLNRFHDAAELCQALAELQASRQVRTFSLGALGSRSLGSGSLGSQKSSKSSGTARAANLAAPGSPPVANVPTGPVSRPASEPAWNQVEIHEVDHSPHSASFSQQIDLDALVDELDDYDP